MKHHAFRAFVLLCSCLPGYDSEVVLSGSGSGGGSGGGSPDPIHTVSGEGEESSSSGNDTTEAGSVSFCGDGIVDSEEECDDGNDINTDACLNCKNAICGDGHVLAGEEQCDNGILNTIEGCTPECYFSTRRIFISSKPYALFDIANFDPSVALSNMDFHCSTLSHQAGLGGNFEALIAVYPYEGISNPLFARLGYFTGYFRNIKYDVVAKGVEGIRSLSKPILYMETGEAIAPANMYDYPIWIGMDKDGISGDINTCNFWTSPKSEEYFASVTYANATMYGWWHRENISCDTFAYLLCVEYLL